MTMIRNIFLYFLIFLLNKNIFSKSLFETKFNKVEFISNNIDNKKLNIINEIKYNSINKIFADILMQKDYKKIKTDLDQDFINTLIKNIIIEDEKIINITIIQILSKF